MQTKIKLDFCGDVDNNNNDDDDDDGGGYEIQRIAELTCTSLMREMMITGKILKIFSASGVGSGSGSRACVCFDRQILSLLPPSWNPC